MRSLSSSYVAKGVGLIWSELSLCTCVIHDALQQVQPEVCMDTLLTPMRLLASTESG